MILGLALFSQLAAACAPQVAPETLAAVVLTESRFETLTVEDDTARRRYRPASEAAAVALAERLIRKGHSVDLGLMQVNSHNLAALGLTVRGAFDACASLAAGGRMLLAQYQASSQDRGVQPALREALSRYNTGTATRGLRNGYVGRVERAAAGVVPAMARGAATAPEPARAPAAPARRRRHVTLRGT